MNQDIIVSVYNIHHSDQVWDDPEAFLPERFPLEDPPPTEANTDFRCWLTCTSMEIHPC